MFFLDNNPVRCAFQHCDQHLAEQIEEITKLLCTAANVLNRHPFPQLYPTTNPNSSDSLWVRRNWPNAMYAYACAKAMDDVRQSFYLKTHPDLAIADKALAKLAFLIPKHNNNWQPLDVDAERRRYKQLNLSWVASGKQPMSFTNRPFPQFMEK